MDKSRPVILQVGQDSDGNVVWRIGETYLAIPVATAKEFAERTLSVVGDIEGATYFLTRMTQPKEGG